MKKENPTVILLMFVLFVAIMASVSFNLATDLHTLKIMAIIFGGILLLRAYEDRKRK